MIQPVCENIWRVDFPLRFWGLHLGARMTVVRDSMGVHLHSPVLIAPALQEELAKIGPIASILAPNKMHHLFLHRARKCYPEAKVYVAPGLAKKIGLKSFTAELPETAFSEEIEAFPIAGAPTFNETVFYDRRTKTLICTDLIQHFDDNSSSFTRFYLKRARIWKEANLSRFLRPAYRNRAQTKDSLSALFERDIERILPAHGSVIEGNGSEVLKHAYSWL